MSSLFFRLVYYRNVMVSHRNLLNDINIKLEVTIYEETTWNSLGIKNYYYLTYVLY